ncbi:MAG TPA: hypothetical protein VIH92_00085 [Solirubrobacteraceae bacterium]|jgi:hypothetical protein
MKPPGQIGKAATTARIIKAGFRAAAEYDEFGSLVGYEGNLERHDSWSRVEQIAFSRAGMEVEEKATAVILGDMFIAALDLQGGGTLVAILERPVTDAAAEKLTKALDSAVGEYIGPVPAPLAVLGGALLIGALVLGGALD